MQKNQFYYTIVLYCTQEKQYRFFLLCRSQPVYCHYLCILEDTQSKCPQTPKGPARYNHHDGTCKTFHQTLQAPETEFRQGIKKRQNKGSICLCLEPGTVSACVSKANQLKPYEYFSRYLGSTVYIQKTTNKKATKRPYQIDFTQFSKTFLLVSHILPDNHKIPNK